jgi:uncharacterized protein DUF2846
MKVLFISLALVSALTGCGTVRLAEPARSAAVKAKGPSPDLGQIFVCRNGFLGAAIRPTIELDGKPIAVIGKDTYSFNEVMPGSHTLVAKTPEHDSKLEFAISAGEQKYFQTWISAGFLAGWGLIDNFTPEEGKKCVSGANLVEPELELPTKAATK